MFEKYLSAPFSDLNISLSFDNLIKASNGLVTKSVIEAVKKLTWLCHLQQINYFKSFISVSNILLESLIPPIPSPIIFDDNLELLLLHFLLLVLIHQLGNLITLHLYCFRSHFFLILYQKLKKKINEHISNALTVSRQKIQTVSFTSSRMKNIVAPLIDQDLLQNQWKSNLLYRFWISSSAFCLLKSIAINLWF